MFWPIFVAKTKIIYGYNFRAPLTIFAKSSILDAQLGSEYASVIPQCFGGLHLPSTDHNNMNFHMKNVTKS